MGLYTLEEGKSGYLKGLFLECLKFPLEGSSHRRLILKSLGLPFLIDLEIPYCSLSFLGLKPVSKTFPQAFLQVWGKGFYLSRWVYLGLLLRTKFHIHRQTAYQLKNKELADLFQECQRILFLSWDK